MIEHRPFIGLGKANYGWLNANYHFSFGQYRDAGRMNWGRLRVWNDDEIAPGMGFDRTHIATWKSSPMSAKAPLRIRTAWVMKAAPKLAMCRS